MAKILSFLDKKYMNGNSISFYTAGLNNDNQVIIDNMQDESTKLQFFSRYAALIATIKDQSFLFQLGNGSLYRKEDKENDVITIYSKQYTIYTKSKKEDIIEEYDNAHLITTPEENYTDENVFKFDSTTKIVFKQGNDTYSMKQGRSLFQKFAGCFGCGSSPKKASAEVASSSRNIARV